MRRALLIGIDSYANFPPLNGCANDAMALRPLLSRHGNDAAEKNYECGLLVTSENEPSLEMDYVDQRITEFLQPGSDSYLLYFSGHGTAGKRGDLHLGCSDSTNQKPGIKVSDMLDRIEDSKAREVLILLDCCYAGGAGEVPLLGGISAVKERVAILAASRGDQKALQVSSRGQFSIHLEAALKGAAADIVGTVNISSLYAYLSESFGAWGQRPTLKANLDRLSEIRKCRPAVPIQLLRNLVEIFDSPDCLLKLDPSYEPTVEPRDADNEATFATLQKFRAARIVEPVPPHEHLYFAAMEGGQCRLTKLGSHYWQLSNEDRL